MSFKSLLNVTSPLLVLGSFRNLSFSDLFTCTIESPTQKAGNSLNEFNMGPLNQLGS